MTDFDNIIAAGMPALLANTETRQAIIEYIKTITAKARPVEQWREVYYRQSKEVRFDPKEERHTLLKNRPCRLLMIGFWDATQGIGMFQGWQSGEADYNVQWLFQNRELYRPETWGRGDIGNEVFVAKDYMAVIDQADHYFLKFYGIWEDQTLAVKP